MAHGTQRRRWLLLCIALCAAAATPPAAAAPLVAIIIDDVGDNLHQGLRVARLPAPVAAAFLPHTTYARRLAHVTHRRGKEVMLHLPMEAGDGAAAGPGSLTLGMDADEIERVLARNLASLPHVVGINNHMGSVLTSEPVSMGWLMQAIKRRGGLFFVDSRTTVATVAEQSAAEHGIPNLRRNVFLDNEPAPAAIAAQFERLLALARRDGHALAIGHPHAATLDFLERRLPQLAAEGVEIVPVRVLLRHKHDAESVRATAPPATAAAHPAVANRQ